MIYANPLGFTNCTGHVHQASTHGEVAKIQPPGYLIYKP